MSFQQVIRQQGHPEGQSERGVSRGLYSGIPTAAQLSYCTGVGDVHTIPGQQACRVGDLEGQWGGAGWPVGGTADVVASRTCFQSQLPQGGAVKAAQPRADGGMATSLPQVPHVLAQKCVHVVHAQVL